MSEDWGFAPPPFNAEDAVQRLRRDARTLGLTERGGVFERKGLAIAKFVLSDGALTAAVVKKPQRSGPVWLSKTLKSGAEVRDFSAELSKKLSAWSDRDE